MQISKEMCGFTGGQADTLRKAIGKKQVSVMAKMTRTRNRHVPVVDDGRLCGIVSLGDVVKHRLEDMELETNVLRDAYLSRL